jgi:hypothetical protein
MSLSFFSIVVRHVCAIAATSTSRSAFSIPFATLPVSGRTVTYTSAIDATIPPCYIQAMTEKWLPIPGWENFYEVSDHGRVRSIERVIPFKGRTRRVFPRILRPWQRGGRLAVTLADGGRKTRRHVHLLVLETFIGPRPFGLECCHRDDDPTNNRLDNLRWDTHSSNELDKVRNGNHHQAKKTHCSHGHEYTPENTKIGRNGYRWCRECHRIDERERYRRDEGHRERARERLRQWRARQP